MVWKIVGAVATSKTSRRLIKDVAKKMRGPAGKALRSPTGMFALGAAVALPLTWAAVRSLRRS